MKNTVGRPPKYKTAQAIIKKVEEYFRQEEQPTITGLAIFLGFQSRQSLYDYAKKKEFTYSIKRALLFIENEYEKKLAEPHGQAGTIFALKNFGWEDRSTVNHGADGSLEGFSISVKRNHDDS